MVEPLVRFWMLAYTMDTGRILFYTDSGGGFAFTAHAESSKMFVTKSGALEYLKVMKEQNPNMKALDKLHVVSHGFQ